MTSASKHEPCDVVANFVGKAIHVIHRCNFLATPHRFVV